MSILLSFRLLPVRAGIVLVVLALGAAGCGGKSDSEKISDTYSDFVKSIRSNDWDGVCRHFSDKAHQQIRVLAAALEVTNCPAVMVRQYALSGEDNPLANPASGEPKVTEVKVDGIKATANVSPSADADPKTNFVREGRTWKIDADDAPEPESPPATTTGKQPTTTSK